MRTKQMVLTDCGPTRTVGTLDSNLDDAADRPGVRVTTFDLSIGKAFAPPAEQLRGRDPSSPSDAETFTSGASATCTIRALVSRRATTGLLSIRLGTTSSNWKLLSLGICLEIGTHTVINPRCQHPVSLLKSDGIAFALTVSRQRTMGRAQHPCKTDTHDLVAADKPPAIAGRG